MAQGKSYEISKQVVWEAYKRVKANRGAAGVDQQSLEDFETDLKGNLYKIWNRMSSGSYFPPPVRLVDQQHLPLVDRTLTIACHRPARSRPCGSR